MVAGRVIDARDLRSGRGDRDLVQKITTYRHRGQLAATDSHPELISRQARTHMNASTLQAGLAYRFETRAISSPGGDGFPRLVIERFFVGVVNLNDIECIELRRSNGSQHVIAAEMIERVFPLYRRSLLHDSMHFGANSE
jgi:hypothetical protein